VIRQRLREARFPEIKTLDTFDFTAAEGVSATQIHALARGEWVTAPENLIFAGPIGTGKTHLAIVRIPDHREHRFRPMLNTDSGHHERRFRP
jgi:DNA replication protein DnaC